MQSSNLRRLPARLLVVLGLGLALTGCAGAGVTNEGASSSAAPQEAAPAIGVPVTDGDIEYTVNSVTCTEQPMDDGNYDPLPPDGQYCKVNVAATANANVGMFLGEITITTAQINGEVKPDVAAMLYAGTLQPDYIKKGQTLTGDVVFDIAKDDSVKTVALKETPLSEGVVVPVD
ncbi:DUF4352 domain-containing protein [Microbacterium deminutum]|uniref:DUF4352 domain-containing protein n=1 Tax=Microbacterium deminutum TaxID=344164 RepID=A0ABP5CPT6_9MICO